ncbi:Oxygen-independent coproporphyrinogen-III oxidase-like protein [Pirellulimonas nuda]|uniref:Heme chaperone HemW n=1 Tax=Pirellulimonas nuda TaxID=2528009 RepID=A0A518DHW3_9BACT|nr:radical SAM family heme chaperone HemW [Pirellulimonas nuda]QDU91073.1 Oxygen-independent coproporphyrinogen-III oxidase-like protein [Pirellulimonas nuda]
MDPFATPRSAYVHVPFCAHRCGYCNFAVVAGRDHLVGDYLRAIEAELALRPGPCEVDTLYFGGGTPTRLPLPDFVRLSEMLLAARPLAAGAEWTVEANPADLGDAYVARMAELGVTRLSLGAQSLRDAKLRLLERDHAAGDIARTVASAKQHGIRVALDLIFAAPGETLDQWRADLDALAALGPDHASTYGLTFERGTSFWSRRMHGGLEELGDEPQRAMYELAIERLTAAGFEHYEVSNFALPGRRSRHNQVYWSGGAFDALGPGAARYTQGVRETNHRSTTTYLKRVLGGRSPVAERETLDAEARARERLVFGLRRIEGVERAAFAADTGFGLDGLAGAAIEKFVALGMLSDDGERVRLTRDGLLVSDAIWPELL